jgi:Thioesterase-like superfamily
VPVSATAPEHVDAMGIEVFELGPPLAPEFTPHYEYRVLPPFPFGGAEARLEGFVRARKAPPRIDAAHVIGLLDAWMPAYFGVLDAPRALSTVSFMAELIEDPASLPPEVPLRHRGAVRAASEGYVLEMRELWAGDTLVALNQQTFAMIR